eukprot:TRINITY_DN324_c0_g2_i1.p3 TRINITY_DN324_c0_g2~~TRINITY_DN324_c0_g2_i1.p3  ORF type:complete len:107 (+),score=11.97 TRINITY_DN324_c0_g2_i1:245-565(+)
MESIVAFLPPSLMVRSTCTAFRAAAEKVHKPVKKHWATSMDDALASASLVEWAMQNGFQPQMAYKASIRRGDVPGCVMCTPLAPNRCWHSTHGWPPRAIIWPCCSG